MNTYQIIVKTVITTLDFILMLAVSKDEDSNRLRYGAMVFILMNGVGIWI